MTHYDIYVKGSLACSKPEPVRIFSHKILSDTTLGIIRQMTFEEASRYCRNVLGASIMRGHSEKDEE